MGVKIKFTGNRIISRISVRQSLEAAFWLEGWRKYRLLEAEGTGQGRRFRMFVWAD